MTNVIRNKHRLTGSGGAGSPATVDPSGVIALNFDVGAGVPELWASDGSSWKRINSAALTYATSSDIITGTDTVKTFNASVMAGASVLGITAGVADASKYLRLDANGQIASGVVSGVVTTTGAADAGKVIKTDSNGLLDMTLLGSNAVNTSTGATDAGKLVKLDANGQVAGTMLDYATALEIQNNAGTGTINGIVNDDKLSAASVKTFGSTADNGKFVRVTTTGKIDPSLLPASAMEFQGTTSAAGAPPASPGVGDVYLVSTAGTFGVSWTGISGKAAVIGDQIVWDGSAWNLIQTANPDLSGYLPLAGTAGVAGSAMASGAVIKMNPATAGDIVFDANGGALDGAVIDGGTF